MNFVLDTNVIISALYKTESIPYETLLFAFNGRNNFVYYTKEIFEEYIDVLNRKKFNFDKNKIITLLAAIKERGVLVNNINYRYKEKFIHEDDRKFYELAKSYECYLITGNKKHYPSDPIVMKPKEFFDKLEKSA